MVTRFNQVLSGYITNIIPDSQPSEDEDEYQKSWRPITRHAYDDFEVPNVSDSMFDKNRAKEKANQPPKF